MLLHLANMIFEKIEFSWKSWFSGGIFYQEMS